MKQATEGKQLFSLYDMVVVGVMAAIIFVLTYFVQIPIPTPAGQTMIKSANIFILLAGLLFGGLRGGLAGPNRRTPSSTRQTCTAASGREWSEHTKAYSSGWRRRPFHNRRRTFRQN